MHPWMGDVKWDLAWSDVEESMALLSRDRLASCR